MKYNSQYASGRTYHRAGERSPEQAGGKFRYVVLTDTSEPQQSAKPEPPMSEQPVAWHHILHPQKLWVVYRETEALREAPGMLIPLWPEGHTALHQQCPEIPPICRRLAKYALGLYEPSAHPLEALDNMMFAIEEATKPVKRRQPFDPYDIDRAFFVIRGMERQREPIRKAMVAPDLRTIIDLGTAA